MGWVSGLAAKDVGICKESVLDAEACELVVDDQRVPLTPLELGVMQYLSEHEGKVVTRVALLEGVWGYSYTEGSNVVDRKISSLRRKLGVHASMIETVSGMGYRFRER